MTHEKIGKCLGRIVSGIAICSAGTQEQNREAMLASWYQQVSFDPPMITMAIHQGRPIFDVIEREKKFALNILSDDEKDMVAHFGKGFAPGDDPFVGIELKSHDSKLPLLADSLGFLIAEVRQIIPAGDHSLLLAEVVDGELQNEGKPMVHVRRNGFHY